MEMELVVERISQNKLNDKKLAEQVKDITEAANKKQQSQGVLGKHSKVEGPTERPDGYLYSFTVTLVKDNYRSETAAQKCIEHGKRFVQRRAEAHGWKLIGNAEDIEEQKLATATRGKLALSELSDKVIKEHFDGIYERDAHIRLIHRGVQAAIKSNFEERNHTLLYGQPAAAKTVLFKRLKDWYESPNPEVERVAMINSVTLSKAGLETWLLDKAQCGLLPEVICFDEIEKFNMENLNCLLGIMDDQAKISRTNAKIGKVEASAKVIIWATCNDLDKLKEFNKGALFSRFVKRFACVRPSRELMLEIMLNKLEKRRLNGQKINPKWAKVAVDYAFDVYCTNDPRWIASLLDGEDSLLDGTYFADLEAIRDAEKVALKNGYC